MSHSAIHLMFGYPVPTIPYQPCAILISRDSTLAGAVTLVNLTPQEGEVRPRPAPQQVQHQLVQPVVFTRRNPPLPQLTQQSYTQPMQLANTNQLHHLTWGYKLNTRPHNDPLGMFHSQLNFRVSRLTNDDLISTRHRGTYLLAWSPARHRQQPAETIKRCRTNGGEQLTTEAGKKFGRHE